MNISKTQLDVIFQHLPYEISSEHAPWTELVREDFHVQVFEDIYPVTPGHLLFVPKHNTMGVLMEAIQDAIRHGQRGVESGDWDAFNIGMNLGAAAGQTVAWPHVHMIPRRLGDVADPVGGVRNTIPGQGNYRTGSYKNPNNNFEKTKLEKIESNMLNLNPYDEEKFKSRFKNTDLCRSIKKDFKELIWNDKNIGVVDPRPPESFIKNSMTVRQLVGETYGKFSVVPFYYLEPLFENSPEVIYDLGCGWNIFKKYIPNIIGIGAEDQNSEYFHADQWDFVDDEFIKNHQNYFESVFSICALHYHPVDKFSKVFSDFLSMIKPKGRGYLALNSDRMIERTSNIASLGNIESYIRNNLSDQCKFIIIDIDLTRSGSFEGNIKLVFEKN